MKGLMASFRALDSLTLFMSIWFLKVCNSQTFSERRSQFRERNVSGAHFMNYERKKSGAHVFLEERVMSAKLSDERKKSAEDKFIISANYKKQFFFFFDVL